MLPYSQYAVEMMIPLHAKLTLVPQIQNVALVLKMGQIQSITTVHMANAGLRHVHPTQTVQIRFTVTLLLVSAPIVKALTRVTMAAHVKLWIHI
jgi:hypothetical protein